MKLKKGIMITVISLFVAVCVIFFITMIFGLIYRYMPNENTVRKDYIEIMKTLLNEKSICKVSDIFDFDFDRAYVFDDCYLSGEDFAPYYDLDISIEEVETGLKDYNNRIVFVDDQGEFIYEFVYESYILNPYEDGMIIYPDTEFEFYEQQKDDGVVFKIHSTDYYNKEK